MKALISYFIRYPILGNSIILLLFVFGYLGYTSLNTTFFPPQQSKLIHIQASYPGASPEEVEEGIVLKIEDNIKGVTGVERVTSVSSENSTQIRVEVLGGYEIDAVLQDVKNAVDKISSFPLGMESLVIFREEIQDFAISLAISGAVDLETLKGHARNIERDLRAVDGISKISLSGFPNREIEVAFRENDLDAYRLTFSEAINAVKNANVRVTGGKIKGPREEFFIRANAKGYYAEELKNLVLRTTVQGTIVRLGDVADVKDRWSENPNRVFYNGKPAVRIAISNTNQENLFFITDYVKQYISDFNQKKSPVKAYILRDGSVVIKERIDILTKNGIVGIILVLIFLGLFLHVRLAFWVALAIPIAIMGLFMIGPSYGLTINVVSLLGLILVIGILVDDGIVIAENIYQHHERGASPMEASVKGTLEVLPSVTSAILTTMIAFSTFFFIEGRLGDRFTHIGLVVIVVLLISLLEGIFILPAHVAHSRALREKSHQKNRILLLMDRLMEWNRDRLYAPILDFCMKNVTLSLAIPVALLSITIGAVQGSLVKTTFFPIIEFNSVDITLEMPSGTRDNITDSLLQKIEMSVWQVNERYKQQDAADIVTAVSRSIGPGTHQGQVQVTLLRGEKRKVSSFELRRIFREEIGHISGAEKLSVGRASIFGMPVSISINGQDLENIQQAKEKLKTALEKLPSLKDVVDNDPPGLQEVKLMLTPKAFALGLNTRAVMNQVRQGFFGGEIQRLQRGIDEVRVWVRYQETERNTVEQLKNMRIRLAGGEAFPLSEIADLRIERGILNINHRNSQREITVEADIATAKISVTDIIREIKSEVMPSLQSEFPDLIFDFEGQSRESSKTSAAIQRVLPSVLLLMFITVVFTFRSFTQTILVFLLIPFSLIGVAWGHYLQGYILSILSMFGIVALAGIIVNDSLVLVNAMNLLLKRGKSFETALREAALSRFRPVILTSLTTIAGLGPLIFEKSFQAQFLSPMAISVAYGLFFATLLTLLMLPSLLVLSNRLKVFGYWFWNDVKLDPRQVEPAVREDKF